MALHRDIHWIGRQWAVTGYGMQAINQKHGGQFDIDIAHLWDEGLSESLREQKWFNADDFAKGLAVARKRFPGTPRAPEPEPQPEPAPLPAPPPAATLLQAKGTITPAAEPPQLPVRTLLKVSGVITPPPKAVERPTPPASNFQMGIPGRARFVRPWRFPPRSSR
jgi:hypothetical protein